MLTEARRCRREHNLRIQTARGRRVRALLQPARRIVVGSPRSSVRYVARAIQDSCCATASAAAGHETPGEVGGAACAGDAQPRASRLAGVRPFGLVLRGRSSFMARASQAVVSFVSRFVSTISFFVFEHSALPLLSPWPREPVVRVTRAKRRQRKPHAYFPAQLGAHWAGLLAASAPRPWKARGAGLHKHCQCITAEAARSCTLQRSLVLRLALPRACCKCSMARAWRRLEASQA